MIYICKAFDSSTLPHSCLFVFISGCQNFALRRWVGDSRKHFFQPGNVLVEIEFVPQKLPPARAQLPAQRFVGEQVIDARGKLFAIHPWDEKAILAIDQPFADATRRERDYWQAVAHRLQADRSERFGPH